MNNFAPVFIPTLCRYEHFKRCVESLSKCTHADKTDLYIALDYPLKDSHWDGYRKIEAYLSDIKGFASVSVIKRSENYGAIKNYLEGQTEAFQKYDRLIFAEDDNEFSPNFLDYMNKGLERFEDDRRIYAICGYNYPIEMPSEYFSNFYIWKGFSAWGYATWKDKNAEFINNFNCDYVLNFLSSIYNVYCLTRCANHYLPEMLKVYKTKKVAGDVVMCSLLVLKEAYCVFPVISKVKNYGHDGSGENCGAMKGETVYNSQAIDRELYFNFDLAPAEENKCINSSLRSHFNIGIKAKSKLLVKYVFFLLKTKKG